MDNKQRRNSVGLSISIRMLLIFFTCLLPIQVFSLIMNDRSKNTVIENINESLQAKITFTNTMLQDIIYNVLYQSVSVVDSESLVRYAALSQVQTLVDFELSMLRNQVQRQAHQIHTINPLIEKVFIYLPRTGELIDTPSEYGTPLSREDMLAMHTAFDERYLKPPIVVRENTLYLISWSYDFLHSMEESQPSILVSVAISSREILKRISTLSDYNDGFFVLRRGEFFQSTHPGINSVYDFNAFDTSDYSCFTSSLDAFEIDIEYLLPNAHITGATHYYRIMQWFIWGVTIFLFVLFTISLYRILYKPFDILNHALAAIVNGDFHLQDNLSSKGLFAPLYSQLNIVLNQLNVAIQQVVDNKLAAREAIMRQLHSKMNPHFMYNSLFTIACLCRDGDNEQAALMVERLSGLLRFIAKSEQEYCTLETELRYAEYYLDIQQVRFGNRVSIEIAEVPEKFRSNLVPRLILQPLLENIYIHGISDSLDNAIIRMDFKEVNRAHGPADNYLAIIVENSGTITDEMLEELRSQFSKRQEMDGALVNVNTRLKLFFGYMEDVCLDRSSLGGLMVTMFIY